MKSKPLFILLFLLAHLCSMAQSTKFDIGGSTSYVYSYRNLTSSGNTGAMVKKFRDENESPASGIGLSGDFVFSLTSKFYMRSAVSVNSFGYSTQSSDLNFGDGINDTTGFANTPATIYASKINHRFISLSIPVLFGCKIKLGHQNNRFLLLQTGLNNHLILGSKTSGEYRSTDGTSFSRSTNDQSSYNNYYISSLSGIGYLYQPDKHGIAVTLFFDYGLSPINKNTTFITQRTYFGGVNLSYSYRMGE
jgi:hypothetical protein